MWVVIWLRTMTCQMLLAGDSFCWCSCGAGFSTSSCRLQHDTSWRIFRDFLDEVLKSVFSPNIDGGHYCWWQKSGQPVEVGSLSHYLQDFIHPRAGSLPSTVGLTLFCYPIKPILGLKLDVCSLEGTASAGHQCPVRAPNNLCVFNETTNKHNW